MTKMADLREVQNKKYGAGTIRTGKELQRDPPRLPTGVFSVDMITGGGLPLWGSSCMWGPESGGKTTLTMNAVAMAGKLCWRCFRLADFCECSESALRMSTYWGEVEGTLDRDWAERVGMDMERVHVGYADYGEQHINIADQTITADDCGLVVIDSLAALVPAGEMDSEAEQGFIGKQAHMIGRMVRKLKQRMIQERKNGHPVAIIFTNQLRMKIGQMFGDPETMSGGHGMKHEFSLLLRCSKKSLTDPDKKKFKSGTTTGKDLGTRHSVSIRKAKVLTFGRVAEYVRATAPISELGLNIGQVDDYATVMTHAKKCGIVEKVGAKWHLMGIQANTLDQIKTLWQTKPEYYWLVQRAIIDALKEEMDSRV